MTRINYKNRHVHESYETSSKIFVANEHGENLHNDGERKTSFSFNSGDSVFATVNPLTAVHRTSTNKVDNDVVTSPRPLLSDARNSSRISLSSEARRLRSRASELIVRVPAQRLRRIARTRGMTSLSRETQHFVGITSINGLLRIYRSRGRNRLFWIIATGCCFILLLYQVFLLVQMYANKPTLSQVSFLLQERGLPFPAITICNYNPIRRSFVEKLNKTGQFSKRLLDYIIMTLMEVQFISTIASRSELELAHEEYENYIKQNPHFTLRQFFWNSSLSCRDTLKICSFAGREFDCCKHARELLTDIGKCYQLDLEETDDVWKKHLVQVGVTYGLQVFADFHREEQLDQTDMSPPFTTEFESGFRYYVHSSHASPFLLTNGISVSPGFKVYSAISPTTYILLPRDHWGNCTEHWPSRIAKLIRNRETNETPRRESVENADIDVVNDLKGEAASTNYSSTKCKAYCRAQFFETNCGCSPFVYNVHGTYRVCAPYEVYKCVEHFNEAVDARDDFYGLKLPSCSECKIECYRWVYHTYNSYAVGFSLGSLAWLHKRNRYWTPAHVRSNFAAINIYYRDMCHTEYRQEQSVSVTEILSDIGGNMGLFLGMSILSLTEFIIYITKITWLFISKQRREHMLAKKRQDEERERRLQETLELAVLRKKFAEKTTDESQNRRFSIISSIAPFFKSASKEGNVETTSNRRSTANVFYVGEGGESSRVELPSSSSITKKFISQSVLNKGANVCTMTLAQPSAHRRGSADSIKSIDLGVVSIHHNDKGRRGSELDSYLRRKLYGRGAAGGTSSSSSNISLSFAKDDLKYSGEIHKKQHKRRATENHDSLALKININGLKSNLQESDRILTDKQDTAIRTISTVASTSQDASQKSSTANSPSWFVAADKKQRKYVGLVAPSLLMRNLRPMMYANAKLATSVEVDSPPRKTSVISRAAASIFGSGKRNTKSHLDANRVHDDPSSNT